MEPTVSPFVYPVCKAKIKKRVEWERLLVTNRAPLFGDLPEELHKLLQQLDERLGVKKARAPQD